MENDNLHSINEIVKMVKEVIIDANNQTIYVLHGDAISDAEYLKDLLEKEISPKEVRIEYLGPIIGVSTGTGTLAVYVKGKKVELVGE